MKRREFVQLLGITPALLTFPGLGMASARQARWDRVLVLLELNGGNDGLNTVVPYTDSQYYSLRPQLAVARESVLQLSDRLGFNPALEPLMPAWQAHELAIVLGVGYPKPNRSHFRSIEIWETGADSDQVLQEGWIARLFAKDPPPASDVAEGIVIGRTVGPLYGHTVRTIVMQDTQQFLRQARDVTRPTATSANPALAHILSVQAELYAAAGTLEQKLAHAPALSTAFPKTLIGRQLETAAGLLVSGTATPVIKVSHGSFDTHSQQRGQQDRLLGELAAALAAFRDALKAAGQWDRVLVLTYSEFGRRAAENGSHGTDHGTAAPHFLLGGGVKGGLYGDQPSLGDLAEGDLRYQVDYRSLYATVIQRWWGLSDNIFKRRYPSIECIAVPA